jgi:serine protein kinase
MDLLKKLEEFRTQEQALSWEGTFADYFDIVKSNPKVAQLSHARIYDMVMSAGVEPATGQAGAPRYEFFADEIYGLDRSLQQVVEYFRSSCSSWDPWAAASRP